MTKRKKYLVKEMREYIFVSHVIDGDTWSHDLGGGGDMFPIFHTYPLNDLIIDTQLSVDLG